MLNSADIFTTLKSAFSKKFVTKILFASLYLNSKSYVYVDRLGLLITQVKDYHIKPDIQNSVKKFYFNRKFFSDLNFYSNINFQHHNLVTKSGR
jgi:hypothetical protein